ncbi:MAG: hypothetical protein SWY16_05370 [Cyanobacteriota bacterium]|nr:hypothetical protein [Cyanobacteriota bacterium]
MKPFSPNANALPSILNVPGSIESAKLRTWTCGSKSVSVSSANREIARIDNVRIDIVIRSTSKLLDASDLGNPSENFSVAMEEHRGYNDRLLHLQPKFYRSSERVGDKAPSPW